MMPTAGEKYVPFKPIDLTDRQWPNKVITKPPIWCAVDLRDGNQALIEPMDSERKTRMFKLLCRHGLQGDRGRLSRRRRETDFDFVRELIEQKMIPDDVTIQVLTQCRPGADRAHLRGAAAAPSARSSISTTRPRPCSAASCSAWTTPASSTSPCRAPSWSSSWPTPIPAPSGCFEYSPESFTGTELEFARDICDAVGDVYKPTPQNKMIINLPATVEMATPNIYADQIEWMPSQPQVPRFDDPAACIRTTTAAPASRRPSWATWPAPTASRAACSATASAPATSTS